MLHSMQLLSYLGCLSSLVLGTPILESAVQPRDSLVARQGPFQRITLDADTTYGLESNGVWQLIDATGDGVPDLAYIKTSNTGTRSVEVHIASSASGFQTRIVATGTTFGEETDGTWLLAPSKSGALPDLVFIKTSNTPSGRVEVHIASGSSGYRTRTLETATAFGNEDNGVWSLYDYDGDGVLDLVYVKTRNTGSGRVEVHVASGASTYSQFIAHTATVFQPANGGFWHLGPYTSGAAADLVYIKNTNTAGGRVEVYVASKSSGYQERIFSSGSTFRYQTDGVFSLIDYTRDGVLDLSYIKYRNTGGNVKVQVASG
ncbi:putative fg-gap repeat protein [Rosellinia necatrix]|uniref:Putative fg-gap repeat protein n=1 Tax=Rosellinia necatrix TaxID=77044 RepID=A0A1S7ULV5_ROSNE|nr:putative fg-gap repeat protein [Rosellinia necatrix]